MSMTEMYLALSASQGLNITSFKFKPLQSCAWISTQMKH